MKTKKYSISLKALAALVFAFAFSFIVNAQFVAPSPSSNANLTAEEVRAASTVSYNLSDNHNAGDFYRWVVVGGTIDDAGGTLTIDIDGDSSIVEFTEDLVSIDVLWDNTIVGPLGSDPGLIFVQKTVGGTCASELQTLGITMWNPATANLDLTGLITELCSGEALGFTVPADLTGAPNATAGGFDVDWSYAVTAGTLTDLTAGVVDGVTGTVVDNDALAQIPLPDGLVNTGLVDATFELTLTAMLDDFDEGGSVAASATYVITVHPTPATGEINSSSSLTRR